MVWDTYTWYMCARYDTCGTCDTLGTIRGTCDMFGTTRLVHVMRSVRYDTFGKLHFWFCAASFCNFCGSIVRDVVVITRSLLRCQMLFVVFVMCVVFQVRLAWDRTGVNVNGMVNGRQTTRHLFWLF